LSKDFFFNPKERASTGSARTEKQGDCPIHGNIPPQVPEPEDSRSFVAQ
jgi:hypothetical protein